MIWKIKIFNFGPIKKFEFDLSKDLVIAYGKNNIGKSYAMSIVYLLLKHLLKIKNYHLAELIRSEVTDEKNNIFAEEAPKGKEFNITDRVNDIIKNSMNTAIADILENSFINTFGELADVKNYRSKHTPLIQLNFLNQTIQLTVGRKIRVKQFSSGKEIIVKISEGKDTYRYDEDKYFLFGSSIPAFAETLHTIIRDRYRELLEGIKAEISDVYFLPASRSGLYTGSESFFPIIAELSKKRAYITEKIELPEMAEPIADYILRLSEIDKRPTRSKSLMDIARRIEKNILKGEVSFDTDKKRLTYSPENSSLVLKMNAASSMVSELSPIVAFLKYILGKNSKGPGKNSHPNAKPIIFIEEPEAHLHPEAQVQLAEIFVELIHAGIKLIISSHSNYIFNKLSNMVISKALDLNRYAPIILADTDKGSVSKLMAADDLGVEDENFLDTAVDLYEERENILETLN
ncbi:MAG: AAA family ATPase [Candidatus Aminicenantes bacterium]|nr:AAA family ATPase [Candidatus Aminicenantes bacterium]NIM83858.1 AAA family ATPase [Candidatus Aminicenantes bacterium]NIN23322.1 AAA family ATPase [Candidatus Aminicenantes bacterium]NIN47026.1 AAA family ATPase [Candidatus Aminicenantes bacterium]NIN89948.1 AAA family ATPase [Candidatus Aminicenantes bacterium]